MRPIIYRRLWLGKSKAKETKNTKCIYNNNNNNNNYLVKDSS